MINLEKLQNLLTNIPEANARSKLSANKLKQMTTYLGLRLSVLAILSLLPKTALAFGFYANHWMIWWSPNPVLTALNSLIEEIIVGHWDTIRTIIPAPTAFIFFIIGGGDLRERAVRSFGTLLLVAFVIAGVEAAIVNPIKNEKLQKKIIKWQEQKSQLQEDPTAGVSES